MTSVGFLCAGFGLAALLSLVGLIAISAADSVHITKWRAWWKLRKQAKERARARRLPVAELMVGEEYEVVSLRDVTVRRCK